MFLKLHQISNTKECLEAFREVLQEKMRDARPDRVAGTQADLENYFASIKSWESNPGDLEHISWELYPQLVKLYSILDGFQTQRCDSFLQAGFRQGIIPKELMDRFLQEFSHTKTIRYRSEDTDLNYDAGKIGRETEEALNLNHIWYSLKERQLNTLKPILASLKQPITECIGTPWRVINIRAWETIAQTKDEGPTGWHTDNEPLSVLKIMIYPHGADAEKGTIELQFPDGPKTVVGEFGTWVFFKNSEIVHRGRAPKKGKRLAIEINLIPSFSYDLKPIYVGQNSRFPRLPWQYPQPLTISNCYIPILTRVRETAKRTYHKIRKIKNSYAKA